MRKIINKDKKFSYYLFKPDLFHLYATEEKGREEPVHRYSLSHLIHMMIYLLCGGYEILYMKKDNHVVSYCIYTRCHHFVFDSENQSDYYIIFYYTYPEYRGNGYAVYLMHTLFDVIPDTNDFYMCIDVRNTASVAVAQKVGFVEDGYVKKSGFLHTLVRVPASSTQLFKFKRGLN